MIVSIFNSKREVVWKSDEGGWRNDLSCDPSGLEIGHILKVNQVVKLKAEKYESTHYARIKFRDQSQTPLVLRDQK